MSTTAQEDKTLARLVHHMAAVRNHWDSVVAIKEGLRDDDGLRIKECWQELDRDTQIALWVAPKFGGIWTTRERERIREETT